MGATTPHPKFNTRMFTCEELKKIEDRLWDGATIVEQYEDTATHETVFEYEGKTWKLRFYWAGLACVGSLDDGFDIEAVEVRRVEKFVKVVEYEPVLNWS